MERQGADIIELGIPYSDPIAEGPVIQAANARALKHSIKIIDIMHSVKEMRKTVRVPLLYLLYCNCILQYGIDRFFSDCAAAGLDGVIIPDLPYEERDEFEGTADKYGIIMITLVAPTSGERVQKLAKNAKGFVYCVSSLGVTGVRNSFDTDFDGFFTLINKATSIPKALGFGISTAEHVKRLKGYCDGLIVGSAMVKRVAAAKESDAAIEAVGEYTAELRKAMDE
jgi:tryptophan synthase alpha chain